MAKYNDKTFKQCVFFNLIRGTFYLLRQLTIVERPTFQKNFLQSLLGLAKVYWLNPNITKNCLFAQTTKDNKEVLKIKKVFSKLLTGKIIEIQNINKNRIKNKLKINMTTKGPSKKQIIIPIKLPHY